MNCSEEEEQVVATAFWKALSPGLSGESAAELSGLMQDLFPRAAAFPKTSGVLYYCESLARHLEDALLRCYNLPPSGSLEASAKQTALQLYEAQRSMPGVFLLGKPAAGKSCLLQGVGNVASRIRHEPARNLQPKIDDDDDADDSNEVRNADVSLTRLSVKSLTSSELLSQEGILPSLFRVLAHQSESSTGLPWLVLDGPLDPGQPV